MIEELSNKFICPQCHEYIKASVLKSWISDKGYERRRECEVCGCRFVTVEIIDRLSQRRTIKKPRHEFSKAFGEYEFSKAFGNWIHDDITWCGNECNHTECERNQANRLSKEGVFSMSMFKDTPTCPLYNKDE